MASYRDLADSDAYQRRRVAASLISGSPEGHPGEPPRGGRCVLGGLVLAALLVAGGTASHVMCGHPDARWEDHRLHVSR